jgi:perosamine synthetase
MEDRPKVPLGRMHIDDEMREVTLRILNSGHWIKGPESKAFGQEWAEYCGAFGGVPCSNGSVALIAALKVLGVGPGDEVIVPSHTYIASATCIEMVGAHPVFVEVEPEFHTVALASIQAAHTPRTKAVIAVHLYGQPVAEDVFAWCAEQGLPVIEDAAQGHGASLNGKRVGSFGDLATFSFFPSKNMAVGGDGGAILVNREDLLHPISVVIDHGRSSKYQNDTLGTNFRLSEIQCGIGRVQLRHLDGWVARRNIIASRYLAAFEGHPHVQPPVVRAGAVHAWHQFVVQVEDREGFMAHMDAHGVATGIHYPIPCHLQPVFEGHPQANDVGLNATSRLCDRIVSLPVFPLLEDEEVDRVIAAVLAYPGTA